MEKFFFIGLVVFLLLNSALGQDDKKYNIEINSDKQYQQIHSFGASDAWRIQYVGKNWPLEKRKQIADLLFSLERDEEGNPRGIGLSLWRFYLGAGTKEQGDSSRIQNEWRRASSFLDSSGHYNWSKCQGQQWFLNAAKERGVENFLMFTISPPVFYTKNGLGFPSQDNQGFNIKPGKYDDYAMFLVNVLEHFNEEKNIHFDYISPFNEPQWDWEKGTQEGTPAFNEELFVFMRYLSDELDNRGLSTKIIPGEAASLQYLYKQAKKAARDDQINVFYNPESSLYIGDFPNMEYAISGHSYFTTWPLKKQIRTRRRLAQRMKEVNPGLDYWQTEFCILEKNDEIEGGWGRDLDMPTALYVARVMHSDLTLANAKSWEWWTAVSQFDFKGGLVYLDDGKGHAAQSHTDPLLDSLKYNGRLQESKLLWAFGNFSRFVRPGMVRIDVHWHNDLSRLERATDLQVSAYKNPENDRKVLVFINHTKAGKKVRLEGLRKKPESASLYVTDETKDLKKHDVSVDELEVPPRSVSTLVLDIK